MILVSPENPPSQAGNAFDLFFVARQAVANSIVRETSRRFRIVQMTTNG